MEEELCSYPSPWFMGCDPEDEHLARGGTRGIGSKDTEEVSRGRQLQCEVPLLRQREAVGLRTNKAGTGWRSATTSCVTVGKSFTSLSLPFPTDTMRGLTSMAKAQRSLGRIESNLASGCQLRCQAGPQVMVLWAVW